MSVGIGASTSISISIDICIGIGIGIGIHIGAVTGIGITTIGDLCLWGLPWKHGRLATMQFGLVAIPLTQRSCPVNYGPCMAMFYCRPVILAS